MNCEGVRAVIGKGISATTVAERDAACVHCRTCADCHSMLADEVKKIPPPELFGVSLMAAIAFARDRADPEWK